MKNRLGMKGQSLAMYRFKHSVFQMHKFKFYTLRLEGRPWRSSISVFGGLYLPKVKP